MGFKKWDDTDFMDEAAEAWEDANEVDSSFIKSVTGEEPNYNGEIKVEYIEPFDPILPFGGHKSGVFSSILNKFIDPLTGLPIEK